MARGNYTSKVAASVANFTSKNVSEGEATHKKTEKPKKTKPVAKSFGVADAEPESLLLTKESTINNPLLSYDYKAAEQSSPLKSVTVRLTEENSDFLFTRSLQLGMTKQDYFSLLLEERKASNIAPASTSRPPKGTYKGASQTHTIRIPEDLITFSKMDAARHIMKITEYFNYVLDCEQQRETKNGLRTGRYDV